MKEKRLTVRFVPRSSWIQDWVEEVSGEALQRVAVLPSVALAGDDPVSELLAVTAAVEKGSPLAVKVRIGCRAGLVFSREAKDEASA